MGATLSGRSGGKAGLSFGRPRRKSLDRIIIIINCILFICTTTHVIDVHLEGGISGRRPSDPRGPVHDGHVVPRGLATELVQDVRAAAEDVGPVSHRPAQVDARVGPDDDDGLR